MSFVPVWHLPLNSGPPIDHDGCVDTCFLQTSDEEILAVDDAPKKKKKKKRAADEAGLDVPAVETGRLKAQDKALQLLNPHRGSFRCHAHVKHTKVRKADGLKVVLKLILLHA